MVNRISNTTTQKKIRKIRKARAAVTVALAVVALLIIFVGKKEEPRPLELINETPASPEKMGTEAMANSIYGISVPPNASIAQNSDSSKANFENPEIISPQVTQKQEVLSQKSGEGEIEKTPNGQFPVCHVVVDGDTLSRIAKKYYGQYTAWEPIYEANREKLKSPSSLRIGDRLTVPPPKQVVARTKKHKKTDLNSEGYTGVYVATDTGEAECPPQSSAGKYYFVKKGETLRGIAKREGINFLTLYEVNQKVLNNDPHCIREGMKLWIPAR